MYNRERRFHSRPSIIDVEAYIVPTYLLLARTCLICYKRSCRLYRSHYIRHSSAIVSDLRVYNTIRYYCCVRCVWKQFRRRSARRAQSISAEFWLCGIIRIPLSTARQGIPLPPPPFQPFQSFERASAYYYYYIRRARAHVWRRGHHSVAAAARRNYWLLRSGLCHNDDIVFLLVYNICILILLDDGTTTIYVYASVWIFFWGKGLENVWKKSFLRPRSL